MDAWPLRVNSPIGDSMPRHQAKKHPLAICLWNVIILFLYSHGNQGHTMNTRH